MTGLDEDGEIESLSKSRPDNVTSKQETIDGSEEEQVRSGVTSDPS